MGEVAQVSEDAQVYHYEGDQWVSKGASVSKVTLYSGGQLPRIVAMLGSSVSSSSGLTVIFFD